MAHVEPVEPGALAGLEAVLAGAKANMGFVPNSMVTMAHMPQLTMAFSMLAGVTFGADLKMLMQAYQDSVPVDANADEALDRGLIQLIAYTVSLAAGCRYCQAHTAHVGHTAGVDEEKFAQVLQYETANVFTDEERAVIALALAAGDVPNAVEASHFEALKPHFSDRAQVQIVAVIALFGFLNRWNDTMATSLEADPLSFAQRVLSENGWEAAKHG